jgi:hypothetical protein
LVGSTETREIMAFLLSAARNLSVHPEQGYYRQVKEVPQVFSRPRYLRRQCEGCQEEATVITVMRAVAH